MADQHGAHQTKDAYVVSMCEDFCKSPTAPVGYMISQKLDVSTRVCSTVNGCGTPVLNLYSRITGVTGNEAGVGGGVVSGVNIGMCKPVDDYAQKVRAEGQFVLRHDTVMEMNTSGPDGPGNVLGKIVYLDSLCKENTAQSKPHTNRRFRETKKVNGHEVDVYDTDGDGAQYTYTEGERPQILVGKDKNPGAELHEMKHFEQDTRDGRVDGKLADKNRKPMRRTQAEAEATQVSIDAVKVRGSFDGMGARYSMKRALENRKSDLEEADKKIAEGDFEAASEIAKNNDNACDYIEQTINETRASVPK